MKHSYKINWEHLKAETPKVMRRVGNTLLALSAFIAGYELYVGNQIMGAIAFGIGLVGKALVEFFKVNDNGTN